MVAILRTVERVKDLMNEGKAGVDEVESWCVFYNNPNSGKIAQTIEGKPLSDEPTASRRRSGV